MPRLRPWVAWTAGAVLLLLVAAALVAPRLLDEARLRAEVERRLTDALGRDVTVRGPVRLSAGANVEMELGDVTLAGLPGGPALATVERLTASVAAASLVSGPLAIGDVRLAGPRVHLHVDRAGRANWEGLGATPTADATGPARAWSIASVVVERGALRYTDERDGADWRVDELALETGRVALPAPVTLAASFAARRGDAPPLRATLATTATAEPGADRYALDATTLELQVPRDGGAPWPASVAAKRIAYAGADGVATLEGLRAEALGVRLRADARASALATAPRATASFATEPFAPRKVLDAFAVSLPPMQGPDALARAAFAGRLDYADGVATLADLDVRLDATTLTGTASLATGEAARWTFDLAADRLVADPYLKPAELRGDEPIVLPLDALRALDARGRLRVGELVAEGVRLRDVVLDLDGEGAAR